MESSKYMQYKSALFSVKSISSKHQNDFYVFVNITNSIKDMFNGLQLYSINMILNSFEINKVLFDILDFPTLIISMTMDPREYYLQTYRCQNSDNSNLTSN